MAEAVLARHNCLKILASLQQANTGNVTIHGDKNVQAGDMGIIFKNYYLFEWRTVYESLLLAAKKNNELKGKEDETIIQYASDFHLTEELKKYPQQLSGGQRQRVSIIQQLLKGSDFLLLDEPFSGLDVYVVDKVTELLLQISVSDERKTLIIVSHDISTSVAISDTVIILGNEAGKPGATIKQEIALIKRDLA